MLNRQQRRKAKKYTLEDVQSAIAIAMEMKKHSKGHLFTTKLKNRCVWCGVSMKTKKQCPYWLMTMFDRIQTILINPNFFTADNLQALWLQHGEEYQNIKLPLVFTQEKKNDKKA